MPRTIRRAGAALLPLLLVLVAGCSAGPSDRPAVAYRGDPQPPAPTPTTPGSVPLPPLGPPAQDALDWRDCTARTRAELGVSTLPEGMTFSCSGLLTSLDPPGARSTGVTRIALLGVGSGSVPLVVVNDIRGEPGTTFAARLALQLPPEMLKTFRIIGMDRRGSGESDPAACIPQVDRNALVGFDPRATSEAKIDRLLDSVRSASQECLLELEKRAQAYDTVRAASDLEELRIELGVPHLHAIGRGEGSRVLTTYAQRYPATVGRMVLDGAPDPVLDTSARTKNLAKAAENTFDVFARECVENGGCPLGPDPRKTVEELVQRTRGEPLSGPGTPVTAGEIVRAILLGLKDPESWPRLARALDAATRGDGSGINRLLTPLVRGSATSPAALDSQLITRCNDTMLRLPTQRGAEVAAEWVRAYPLFGGVFAQRLIRCSLWPRPQQALPDPPRTGLPPMPVIATANDPLTPELGSEHMADRLPAGITVKWQGSGHGAIGRSRCVTEAVSRFFTAGTVPPDGMVCPA